MIQRIKNLFLWFKSLVESKKEFDFTAPKPVVDRPFHYYNIQGNGGSSFDTTDWSTAIVIKEWLEKATGQKCVVIPKLIKLSIKK